MDRRKAGRALVLLGAALLLLGNVLWCAVHDAPTLLGVLADIRFWGLSEAFSGDHDSVAALLLLGNVLMDAYLLCVAALAPLLLRGGRARALGPLAAHLLGFSLSVIHWGELAEANDLLVALGVAALVAGAALLARRRPRGGSVPARYGRAAGDVATLGLAFVSGAYLYTACCVVASEFYASGMAKLAGQVGHAVDRGWVALRLAHFAAASAVSLLVALDADQIGRASCRERV